MNRRMKAACVALVVLALAAGGCGTKSAGTAAQPVLVKTMTVGAEKGNEEKTFSGTVHGYFESPLAFQVGGRVMARYVNAGDRVTAGQALMKVDSKDAEEQRAAAESTVISAKAQYDLASTTLKRYTELHAVDAISDLAMDQTQNQFDLAAAQLSQAEATLSRADNNLSFTTLTADRDGVIGSTMYEVGQVVAAGTPVVLIVDDSRMDVHISFPEKDYGKYGVGMPCTVTFWALPGVTAHGTIREIAAAPNTSTGTYDVKVTLTDAPDTVAVGMTAEVRFGDGAGSTIRVPLSAIASQSTDPSVWVVRDGKAKRIAVTVGDYGIDTVEIKSGLAKGDKVITAGTQKLTEGEEVRT